MHMVTNRKSWILVIALFAVAGLLFARLVFSNSGQPTAKLLSPDERIAAIQKDPHMPPQAKAIAIGQLRAHKSQAQAGGH